MAFDTSSLAWQALKATLDDELKAARDKIEARGVDPVETEYWRGRLALAKELLLLPDQHRKRELAQAEAARVAALPGTNPGY